MTRKQWAALLLAGLLCIVAACGTKPPADPDIPPAPSSDSDPAPSDEAPADEPLAACTPAPVTPAAGEKVVTAYFACGDMDYPTVPIAVQRAVPDDEDDLTAALLALLAGPTEAERAAGFRSWFSAETAGRLNDATIGDDGHAVINFQTFSHMIPNASTSAGSEHLMAEIGATVAQFPAVQTFEVQFDGSCDLFGDWQQTGCITWEAEHYR